MLICRRRSVSGLPLLDDDEQENFRDDLEDRANEEDESDQGDESVDGQPVVEGHRVLQVVALDRVDVQLIVDRAQQRKLGLVETGAAEVVGVDGPDHDAGQLLVVSEVGLEPDGSFIVVTDPLEALRH